MDPVSDFKKEVKDNICGLSKDEDFKKQSLAWNIASADHHYTYNFKSLGRPIIQFPQDVMALHEIIWQVKPDLIIETGIAHGGSLVSNASVLALLEYAEAQQNSLMIDPSKPKRKVLGIDIDIRKHNRQALESHPLFPHIDLIEGSSIEQTIIDKVIAYSKNFTRILVCLDSNHTHEHVLSELQAYAPLVSMGSYCVVSDTIVE
ncbi:cephalosporin hydroxylase family protein, partial [sulfur-oxidizing endosymbiont of Gigantopelta aegis]|uniref:cephalosporin hydroxylase family protein n=1 Tax=sulfur-oxidizing endosymbiont of Gigantopelta aegis TaxID=2794934 RepID=UPI0018DE397C